MSKVKFYSITLLLVLLLTSCSYYFLGGWSDLYLSMQYQKIIRYAQKQETDKVSALSERLLQQIQKRVEQDQDKLEYWILTGDILVLNRRVFAAKNVYSKAQMLLAQPDARLENRLIMLQKMQIN